MAASLLHQTIVETIRSEPRLVLELLRAARAEIPTNVSVSGVSASFSPALDDLHVDAAVELRREDGTLDRVVLIDVQVARLADKAFTLPVYQALARRRHRVPCDVIVIALTERLAQRLRVPIRLGGGSIFRAIVIGRAELEPLQPRIGAMPAELVFLRALLVAKHASDGPREVLAAAEAFEDLPVEIGMLYLDLIVRALPRAVRVTVERMMEGQRYQPKSRLIRSFIERGRVEGREEGRVEGREEGRVEGARAAIRTLLDARGISLRPADETRLSNCSDGALLGRWVARAATAATSADVFQNDD